MRVVGEPLLTDEEADREGDAMNSGNVGLAVGYNVWQYYQVTGDRDFLAANGAEMLVEISRFFAGLARHDPVDGRYHIEGVMGPDEFHDGYPDRPGEGVDDNAYANVLVSWLLQKTIETYRLLAHHHCGELWDTLGLTDEEVNGWDEVSRRLAVPFLDGGSSPNSPDTTS